MTFQLEDTVKAILSKVKIVGNVEEWIDKEYRNVPVVFYDTPVVVLLT